MTMLSFIVPAHNEEHSIEETLRALQQAARSTLGTGDSVEVIVVDDDSTDRTAEIAEGCGARVHQVKLRHIAAVRNAGAQTASGDWLFFVDADTFVPAETLAAALRALAAGSVGGGARVVFEPAMPWPQWLFFPAFIHVMSWLGRASGCFLFVRRDAFRSVGGFDERYYAAEDMRLCRDLKRRGRFVILPESVRTSGRKANLYGTWELCWSCLKMMLRGPGAWRRREACGIWYDGRR